MEGKADIFKTSFENKALNKITIAIDILRANIKSRSVEFIGTIKNIIAINKYNPIAKSVLFNVPTSLSFVYNTYIYLELLLLFKLYT